jgi:hypothetical protein
MTPRRRRRPGDHRMIVTAGAPRTSTELAGLRGDGPISMLGSRTVTVQWHWPLSDVIVSNFGVTAGCWRMHGTELRERSATDLPLLMSVLARSRVSSSSETYQTRDSVVLIRRQTQFRLSSLRII